MRDSLLRPHVQGQKHPWLWNSEDHDGMLTEGSTSPSSPGFPRPSRLRSKGQSSLSSNNSFGEGSPLLPRRSFDARSFMAQRVNAEISKRYNIVKEVGAGGYGKVYVAKDRLFNNRLVAIKKVLKLDSGNIEVFQREVKIMKDLDHPSICRLFETYEEDRFMHFVIEYLQGGDLFDRYMEEGLILEPTAVAIIRQIASALKYAHGRGIAHRDMKLENICFCSDGDAAWPHVKVIDWGLGKYFIEGRMSSSVGSSMYSAPEVIESEDVENDEEGYTCACDLWSLGVVAYIILGGKPPFTGRPVQQLKNMKAEKYSMEGDVWSSISAQAKDFIKNLLRLDPKMRLTTDCLLTHPWLQTASSGVDLLLEQPALTQKLLNLSQVLSNLEQFSHAPSFFSICVASVARQLDYHGLQEIHDVFCRLDSNGDGFLDMSELREGFRRVYGADSTEVESFEEMFARLDLDGSGVISYTEFCAGGLGEEMFMQEHVLWASFKTFDLNDNGWVSKSDIQQVLSLADVNEVWSAPVCEEVANEVMEQFGSTEGKIDFKEWLELMRGCAVRHRAESPRRISTTESDILDSMYRLKTFAAAAAQHNGKYRSEDAESQSSFDSDDGDAPVEFQRDRSSTWPAPALLRGNRRSRSTWQPGTGGGGGRGQAAHRQALRSISGKSTDCVTINEVHSSGSSARCSAAGAQTPSLKKVKVDVVRCCNQACTIQ